MKLTQVMGLPIGNYAICFLVSLYLYGCSNKDKESKVTQPNIVIILADDLGYGGIGCYGNSRIKTPNIDLLAKNGIRFTDFHSNGPVCSPTRAALMTGNYQQRSGLEGVIYVSGETRQVGLDTSQVTMAELMKDNGYATGIIGKWHLGYNKEYSPVNQGFDEFYGYLSGNIDYHSHYDNARVYDWWHNLDSIKEKGYTTDLITEHSIDFINRHKDRPFFLYVSQEAPHDPFQGRNDPPFRFPGTASNYTGSEERKHAAYKEMVEVMDEGIGKIMESLRKNGLEDNTLVFFLSDNGAVKKYGNNGGLNGQKGSLLEGGHRVPAIAYWKGKIKPGVSSETLITMDLLPTMLSVNHAPISKALKFDGIDFSDVLFKGKELKERALFWRYQGQKALRKAQWKLLVTKTDTALYDLKKDLKETTDLSDSRKDILKDMMKQLQALEKDVTHHVEMKTK